MFPTWNLVTELEMNGYEVEKYAARHKTYQLFGNTIPSSWDVYKIDDGKTLVAHIVKYGLFQKPELQIIRHMQKYRLDEGEKEKLKKIADPFVKKIYEA